jgi:hypothetical protein
MVHKATDEMITDAMRHTKWICRAIVSVGPLLAQSARKESCRLVSLRARVSATKVERLMRKSSKEKSKALARTPKLEACSLTSAESQRPAKSQQPAQVGAGQQKLAEVSKSVKQCPNSAVLLAMTLRGQAWPVVACVNFKQACLNQQCSI